jgi:hypothetical protein
VKEREEQQELHTKIWHKYLCLWPSSLTLSSISKRKKERIKKKSSYHHIMVREIVEGKGEEAGGDR